ncbi:MAG TPA: histidine phosphatase family protein [Vicinamibacterales bacterium]|nr:histidine phosphatase family protein [Vicinamibacterales bacterium]
MKRLAIVALVLLGTPRGVPYVLSSSPSELLAQAKTLRVYLARHGQTDGNLKGIAQGWTDTPLNDTGREQAMALAERLRGVELDAIYSSTLTRSRTTAETVAAGRKKVKVTSLPGLREVGLGKWENVALNDPIMKTRPPADKRGPEDGESGAQVDERVAAAVKEILNRHRKGTILIVGHAGANGYILSHLLDMTRQELAKQGQFVQDNDELYLVERTAGFPPRVFKFIAPGKFNQL